MNPYTDLGVLDFLLLPFLLALVYGFAYSYRNRHYRDGHPWRPYFIPALSIKIFGAILIGLIYAYYYKGGDTFNYFYHSQVINSAMDESVEKWFNLILRIPKSTDVEYYEYIEKMQWYKDPSTYTVSSLTALLSIITFNSYLPTAVLFAVISFTGAWALFRTFSSLYPNLLRAVSIPTLFIPSVIVWGSGIFKDSLCMFGLGWLSYSIFRMVLKRDFSIWNMIISVFCFLLVSTVKIYIVLAFIPALAIWLVNIYTQKIRNTLSRFSVNVFLFLIIIGVSLMLFQYFSNSLGKYSIEQISTTSNTTRRWISYVSELESGSSYDLGNFSPTFGGIISRIPQAINVTLFRPYIWEVRKPIVLLSALESLLFFLLTIRLMIEVGPKRIYRTILREPTVRFCLIFSLIFSFSVGISSYNFGALSRYKIPALPFYTLGIIIIWYKNKSKNQKIFRLLNI
jgi:hypothetical protein